MKKLALLVTLLPILAFSQAPVISAESTTYNSAGTQATVTWTTDVNASSAVVWGPGSHDICHTPVTDTTTGVTSHSVTITSCTVGGQTYTIHPGQVHDFVAYSTTHGLAANANTAVSNDMQPTAPGPLTGASLDYWVQPFGAEHFYQPDALTPTRTAYLQYQEGTITNPTTGCGAGQCYIHTVVTGIPSNTTLSFPGATHSGSNWFDEFSPGSQEVDIITTPSTPVGSYTLTFSSSVGQNPGGGSPTYTRTWNFVVDAPPTPLTPGTPSSYPAIPSLATWLSDMTGADATNWCTNVGVPGCEQCVSYYDGQLGFLQLAQYTGTSSWNTCANNVRTNYRDNYVIPNNGAVNGYTNFSGGMTMDWLNNANTTSKSAVHLITTNSAFAQYNITNGATASFQDIRENAYMLYDFVDDFRNGNTQSPFLGQAFESALAQLDQACIHPPNAAMEVQPFMLGLNFRSLWHYFDFIAKDPRIPVMTKACMDYMKTNMYIDTTLRYGASTHSFFYNSGLYDAGIDVQCSSCGNSDIRSLQPGIIAPTWARIFAFTGTAAYQTDGDDIWSQGIAGQCTSCNGGKQSAQLMFWSFDYVKYRSAPAQQTVNVSPSTATIPVLGTQQFSGTPTGGTWSAVGCSGTINTSTGIFTASATAEVCTVTDTVGGNSGTGTITVQPFSVNPVSVTLQYLSTQQFTANFAATWAVTSGTCTISLGGLLTAPASPSSCVVTATAVNGGTTATASVSVVAPPPGTSGGKHTGKGNPHKFN